MKNIRQRLPNAGVIAVAITLLAAQTSFGQEPVGPTKPVVVVNTPAQPVPVTGTITGTVNISNSSIVNAKQSGTWSVGIVGTPTVKIDPANNAVVVTERPTQLLLDTGSRSISDGGYPRYGPFDVAQFSKIRVSAQNNIDSAGPFIIYVSTSLSGGQYIALEGIVTLQPGQQFSRVYDVPGQAVFINVGGNGSDRNGIIALFGN